MSKRRTEAEMFPLIASWESSTQGHKEFCESHSLTLSTFWYWRTKYLNSQRSPAELFTELQPEISGKIEITYPKEGMIIIDLADGRSCAVRPSGTEPKIKYYLFGKDSPSDDLSASKKKVASGLESLWSDLEADAKERMG